MTYGIVKNIPRPRRVVRRPRIKYPFEQMEVGDMFFVPGRTSHALVQYVSAVGKRLGWKFSCRIVTMSETEELCAADDEGATIGMGVWRIK